MKKIQSLFLPVILMIFGCQKEATMGVVTSSTVPTPSLRITQRTTQSPLTARKSDPVVVGGGMLSQFNNINGNLLVGFINDGGSWFQIPIQVDERKIVRVEEPYNGYTGTVTKEYKVANITLSDTDPNFDANDLLCFMAKDAGMAYTPDNTFPDPVGTIPGTRREVKVTDGNGNVGYVYIFQQNGTLAQDAGVSYVNYVYAPTSTFSYSNVTNFENSLVTTAKYKWGFSSEWVADKFMIGPNYTNILDRTRGFYGDGQQGCQRNEEIFSAYENAFVVNKTGPIRAIRAYMGAVSGTYTQRMHIFYESRQDIVTNWRVHYIPAFVDAFDFNTSVTGMTYFNNFNARGNLINGTNSGDDTATWTKMPTWEVVTGALGTVVMLHKLNTNFVNGVEARFHGYWDDGGNKPRSNCTGDKKAWGTCGFQMEFLAKELYTDPVKSDFSPTSPYFRLLETTRVIYVDAPNLTASAGQTYNTLYDTPLQVSVK